MLLGITIILCFGYLNQKREISKLNAQPKIIGKTDTLYVKKPFKPTEAYNSQLLPRYILYYGGKNQNHNNSDSTTCHLSNNTDSTLHKEDSIVQMLFSKNDLSLSFFRPSTGIFFTEKFNLDLEKYKYNWVEGKLTQQEIKFKPKFEPYAYVKYRYFNKMADLGLGISFKTRKLSYKLGLNEFYYPGLKYNLGTDLEISITYN